MESRVLLDAALGTHLEQAALLGTRYLPPQHALGGQDQLLTGPATGDPLALGMSFLRDHAAELDLTVADLDAATLTNYYVDSVGAHTAHVYVQQTYHGLPVADALAGVHVAGDGRVVAANSSFLGGLSAQALDTALAPSLSAEEALRAAAAQLGLPPDASVKMLSQTDDAAHSQVLAARDYSADDIPVSLWYVPRPGGAAALAWSMVLRLPQLGHWYNLGVDAASGSITFVADWNDHATYQVLAAPLENPNDGARTIAADPQDASASPFGWHDTNGAAGAEFTDTRGNNVSAQEDADNNNAGGVRPSGGAGLDFSFPIDFSQQPAAYQSAVTTNLFYWNNVIHDVTYHYGFTEPAGNFQVNNYGHGGAAGDAVQADSQDGEGTNNANFGTPPDGSSGRMQMFLFTYTSPGRDGSLENTIVVHEYGHGISNRLTGGPANANALDALQSGGMGEGWSDWFSLMFTQKASDTKLGRYPVGTYVLGQPQTGAGIRRVPYSFDMAVDTLTAAAYNSSNEVHDAGEIWCSALWDLNWLLIDRYGYGSNLYAGYSPGAAGNLLALQLVLDAMKLQPANPSFLQARDAILQADQALTGGVNAEQIWTAFARRGFGLSASTASANSTSITQAFDLPVFNLQVATSTPAVGSIVGTAPVDFVLNFNVPYAPGSVQAVDLAVNGIAADLVTLNDADTLTFHYDASPVTVQGLQSMSMAAGALTRLSDSAASLAFSGTFRYDVTKLAVSSTSPASGSAVSLPLATLQLNFNEPVGAASVGTNDLALTLGTVVGAALVDADTVEYTLAGLASEGALGFTLAAGAVSDEFGNPCAAFAGSLTLDYGTVPWPGAFASAGLPGSLVYAASVAGSLSTGADVDSFTVNLEAGQVLSLLADPDAGARLGVELRAPGGAVLGSASAAAGGQNAVLQTAPIAVAGSYTISVFSAGVSGNYALGATLNAALESEALGGTTNDSLATAQALAGSLIALGPAAGRAAVLGQTDPVPGLLPLEVEPNNTTATANSAAKNFTAGLTNLYQLAISGSIGNSTDADFYNLGVLQAGDVITIVESAFDASRGSLLDPYVYLYRGAAASPINMSENDDDSTGLDSLLYRYAVTATDTYYIAADAYGSETGSYQLSVLLENSAAAPSTGSVLATETESNNTAATANNASASWQNVAYVSQTIGSLPAGDVDVFKFQLTAGDVLSVQVQAASTLDTQLEVLNPAGTTIGREGGDSSLPAGSLGNSLVNGSRAATSGMYSVIVRAGGGTGDYTLWAYLSSGTAPPSPPPATADYYQLDLAAGDVVSAALDGPVGLSLGLRLLDAGGNELAVGAAGPANAEVAIAGTPIAVAGSYYLAASGAGSQPYTLLITRNADFDREDNSSLANAQPLGSAAALGAIVPAATSVVASDDFESGELGAAWTTYHSNATGRARVLGSFGTAAGAFALLLDNGATTPNTLNEAQWTVNLQGAVQPVLHFSYTTYQEEQQAFPASDFTGHVNADGIAISANGVNWHPVWNGPATNYGEWSAFTVDLAAEAAKAGMALAANFRIRFQQYDNNSITGSPGSGDGIGWDELLITTQPPMDDDYSLPLTAGQQVVLATTTPGGGAGEFGNALDPRIEVYAPGGGLAASDDNSAADGRNARLTFVAANAGTYVVRVVGVGGTMGEYVLTASGAPPLVVTNTSDSGPGSLRQALLDANAAVGDSTIEFALGGAGPHVIDLASALPTAIDRVTLDVPAGVEVEVGGGSPHGFPDFAALVKTGAGTLVLGGGDRLVHGANLAIDAGAIRLAAGGSGLLSVDALAIAPAGTLDLSDNDLVVHATAATRQAVLANVTAWLASGASALAWNGPGINSSAAHQDANLLTALGVMLNDDGLGGAYHGTFGGQPAGPLDVLVKYTYYGDADLSGTVDGTDYALADNGFNSALRGWFDGDFDYSAQIDGTDYALIDNAFNGQGGALAGAPPVGVPLAAAPTSGATDVRGRGEASVPIVLAASDGHDWLTAAAGGIDEPLVDLVAGGRRRRR